MSNVLDTIKLPEGIKQLSLQQLNLLSKEVRDYIILTVLKNGGHLGSNLGAVELTTALLYVFDAKKDRILFDVGHQCYAYKILTDRKDKFSKLRQHGGISGFINPKESAFDKLVAGHAGTALAEGIGYAIADKLSGQSNNNVSVLGDGVFANGLTLEALNNINCFGKQIVILNDNDFSIDYSVGGYSVLFDKLRCNCFNGEIDLQTLSHFDIAYIGCVDGHNIEQLIQALTLAKEYDKSVLVHVKTTKGKGYNPAESNPVQSHSYGQDVGFSKGVGESLIRLASQDDKVVVVVAAMGEGNGLSEFARLFPNRYIDVGIAEGLAVSVSCALARAGYKPIVAIYATFVQRSFDQILVEAAGLAITYILGRSGINAGDGETHQGIYVYQTFGAAKNITISYPNGITEFENILNWSVKQGVSTAIAIPKDKFDSKSANKDYPKWELIKKRNNSKTVIFAVGCESVNNALYAAEMLEYYDLPVDVVNVRFPNIIDQNFIGKYENVYVVDEGYCENGFYSKLCTCQSVTHAFMLFDIPSFGSKSELLFENGLSKGKIYQKIKADLTGEDYED